MDGTRSELRCHLDWGPEGAEEAVLQGDVVVIVDVLRFSSTVIAAVSRGVRLLPVAEVSEAEVVAADLGIPVVRSSRPGSDSGAPTDSPLWYLEHSRPGLEAVYPSPNGARLTSLAAGHPHAFIGAFLNASAVGQAAAERTRRHGLSVTVVAAGERSTDFDPEATPRRLFAVEDYLAAGAIAGATGLPLTADAEVAVRAWSACRRELARILRACQSAGHLIQSDRADEVEYCAQVDALAVVPTVNYGWIIAG